MATLYRRLVPSRARPSAQHPSRTDPADVKAWCQAGQAVTKTSSSQAQVLLDAGAKLNWSTD